MTEWVYFSGPLTLLLIASVIDIKHRHVPDWIPIGILLWTVGAASTGFSSMPWSLHLWGLIAGLGVGLILYAVRFGGGDVTLIGAMGTLVGVLSLPTLCFWILALGAVTAILARIQQQSTLPYVPAIALGTLVFVVTGGQWIHVGS